MSVPMGPEIPTVVLSSSNPQVFLYIGLECSFWTTRLSNGLVDCGYTVHRLPSALVATGIPAPKAEALYSFGNSALYTLAATELIFSA